ncbi:MAG: sugar phosphate isomerase/epimerase family protein [Armatimonadota bacterium]|nr:sugar phosphate isomerase/epimerase family protein [Armatimonadota bacterium]
MKLSVITDEISLDLAHALDVMREFGVQGAELRGVWDANIADLPAEKVKQARSVLDDKGFVVSAIASPFFKCPLTDDEEGETGRTHLAATRSLKDQLDLLQKCIELARIFETNLIRVFAFWKRGPLTPEIEDRIVEAFAEPVRIASDAGVVLALENEHACYLGTGAETAKVLARISSPSLKAVWDPGNAFFAGEDPFPAGYDAIREYVAHVHVKDALRNSAGEDQFVVVGEGTIDYRAQFAALKDDGYRGFISLETHCRPGEEASRLSLLAMRTMLAEL